MRGRRRPERHAVAAQDAGDGSGRYAGDPGDVVGAGAQLGTGGEHPLFGGGGGAAGAKAGAAAPLVQPVPALGPEPAHPSVSALPGDTEFGGDMRYRPAVEHDTANQQASAMKRQPRVSVTHQDLRVVVKRQTPLRPEVFCVINYLRPRVTKTLAKYS
ncbi:hypothetical protein GCM10027203_80210 [Nonomuraea fastidiosa]